MCAFSSGDVRPRSMTNAHRMYMESIKMIETQQKIGEDFETKTKQNKHQKVAYNFNSLSTQNTFVFIPLLDISS